MVFTGEDVKHLIWGNHPGFETVAEGVDPEEHRWQTWVSTISREKATGRLYEVRWARANTECQENEYPDPSEIVEVVAEQYLATRYVPAKHVSPLALGSLVVALRDRNVTGTHIEVPENLIEDVTALFVALGLDCLATRCVVASHPTQEPFRASLDYCERPRVTFYADLDEGILECEAMLEDNGEVSGWAGGNMLDGCDDVEELASYFSGGVYLSLDHYREGDVRDFSEVVEALRA